MTNPIGPAGFFALEAGECLDRLDSLFGAAGGPPPDEFLRTARVLRGSALMANQPLLGRAAAGFEALARAIRDGSRPWDAATREQAGQAIEEYRLLVRRVPEWQEGDAARAARLASLLESLAGQGPMAAERIRRADATPAELQTGVRAFVAREGALIASALDRAARAIRTAPDDREPLYMVLRRMQSLQGLAELPELPPLPDILDGIELAIGDLSRLHAPPPGVDAVLEAGARALSRVARDIADRGAPEPDADEPRHFTALLLEAFAVERDVVAIETLYPGGEARPMQRPASVPQFAPVTPPGSLELVSLGEHLVQTAGRLEQARSVTELDLRLYRLVGTLRAAAAPEGDPVGRALSRLARAAREAVATGTARRAREPFVAALRGAGEFLRGAATTDRDRLAVEIERAARDIDALGGEPIVPIESLAHAGEPPAPRPASAPAPSPTSAAAGAAAAPPRGRIETAFDGYGRLRRERGAAPPSLDALVRRPQAPAAPSAPAVVAIESLCYRGRGALERAAQLRPEIQARLGPGRGLVEVRPLLDELLDLLPLALAEPD
ncbi:MAG TPA: hypothetical protein VEU27_05435 [Gemmatimonadales bacterium]|nr:hypothetical protein [Gemmatimonadales bacterium]